MSVGSPPCVPFLAGVAADAIFSAPFLVENRERGRARASVVAFASQHDRPSVSQFENSVMRSTSINRPTHPIPATDRACVNSYSVMVDRTPVLALFRPRCGGKMTPQRRAAHRQVEAGLNLV